MRTSLNKILTLIIIFLTAIGLLLSLFFLIQTWRYRQPVTKKLQSIAKQTSNVVETSERGLNIIEQVMINVYSSTIALESSTSSLVQTMQNSNQIFSSVGIFMGEGLINTITNTQTAIDSAQSSAVVIDNIMTTLSNIPLIGIDYNPSRPLSVALGEVSASLDPLQGTLLGFETNMMTTQSSMQEFSDQVMVLNQNITTIKRNLKSTQSVIDDYQVQLKSFKSWLNEAEDSLPGWIKTLSWLTTFGILWLVLIQSAILLQAVNSITSKTGLEEEIKQQEITPP